jgi:hypothetical protein
MFRGSLIMLLIAALVVAAQTGTADVGKGPIRIAGVEQERSIPCEGRDVFVDGVDHKLTFTGACASLSVAGTGNTINIGLKPGASVAVQGTDQTVRWRSEREPKVKITGVDNNVSRQP